MALVAPRWRRPLSVFVDAQRLLIFDGPTTTGDPLVSRERPNLRAPLPATLPEPMLAALERGRRVRILVATDCAFTRRLSLPLAALPHLRSAVSLQLPKLLPLGPQLLVTDVAVVATDIDRKRFEVELAALKRADLELVIAALATWGLRVGSVHLADGPGSPSRFRFATQPEQRYRRNWRRADRWLTATAAGLACTCVALAATESYRADTSLAVAEAATSDAARSALSERQLLLARLEPLQALAQHENTPSAAAVLSEVSALIPTDSWITTFEIKQRSLRLVGVSPDAADLVKRLAASHLLNDVELRSALSAGIGTGKDRFEITAAIDTGTPGASP
jgi:Tfp pilus assembly protein PilN